MPSSDVGHVIGLDWWLNAWFNEQFLLINEGLALQPAPGAIITVVPWEVTPDAPGDGYIRFGLIERVGGVALWTLDQAYCQVAYPAAHDSPPFLGYATANFTWTTAHEWFWEGAAPDGSPVTFAGPSATNLAFITVAMPWQPSHLRDNVVDYVVGIGNPGGDSAIANMWTAMAAVHQPEQILWVAEAISRVSATNGKTIAPPDFVYKQGADL